MTENKQIKIAIMGQMRAGKDTVAELIQQHAEFETFRFAEGIRAIIDSYFPEVAQGKSRQHYQVIGQSLRQLNPDVWVNALDSQIKIHNYRWLDNLLITDVRQQNEVDYCKANGFILIKVVADTSVRLQRIKDSGDSFEPEQLEHETEQGIDNMHCDYLINNSGSREELQQKVIAIMEVLAG